MYSLSELIEIKIYLWELLQVSILGYIFFAISVCVLSVLLVSIFWVLNVAFSRTSGITREDIQHKMNEVLKGNAIDFQEMQSDITFLYKEVNDLQLFRYNKEQE